MEKKCNTNKRGALGHLGEGLAIRAHEMLTSPGPRETGKIFKDSLISKV